MTERPEACDHCHHGRCCRCRTTRAERAEANAAGYRAALEKLLDAGDKYPDKQIARKQARAALAGAPPDEQSVRFKRVGKLPIMPYLTDDEPVVDKEATGD